MFGTPDLDDNQLDLLRRLKDAAKNAGYSLRMAPSATGEYFAIRQFGRTLYETHDLQAVRDWLA